MRAHDNPFSTARLERLLYFRPEWMGTSWMEIEQRWEELNYRGSLVGPHGVGKTTLIDAWVKRMQADGEEVVRIFLNRQSRVIMEWSVLDDVTGKVVVLDGEEQLSWMARRRFYRLCRGAKGLVVARHTEGQLSTLLQVNTEMALLQRCLREVAPEIEFPNLENWWEEEQGNIRKVLLRCYDHCQAL